LILDIERCYTVFRIREHSQIAAKIEPAINEAMVKKFVVYLDVSEITLRKY
jgi:hypothetical protein